MNSIFIIIFYHFKFHLILNNFIYDFYILYMHAIIIWADQYYFKFSELFFFEDQDNFCYNI